MNLDQYVERIRHQLEVAAESGGEDSREAAERLVPPLDAAIRLALQDALVAAVEQITVEIAPGSVELRLAGRDLDFVVTLPPADPSLEERTGEDPAPSRWSAAAVRPAEGDEAARSRINLRMTEHLKAEVERRSDEEGLSVNSWLVRAVIAALDRSDRARRLEPRSPQGGQRYTGWSR
jgi:hypothetical protein